MSTTNSNSDNEVPHPFYTETSRKSYNSQHDVAEAWADGMWPSHNTRHDSLGGKVAILYTGSPQTSDAWGRGGSEADGENTNFYGVQQDDGTGTLWHYNTREAIRREDGTIISNEQCWSTGFAHCTTPSNTKYRVPFDAVEEFLDEGDTIFDIVDVWGQGEPQENFNGETYYSKSTTNAVVVIDGNDGYYGVFLGRDQSIINGNRSFAFKLSGHELTNFQLEETSTIPEHLLRPDVVQESDLEVVDSREYTKSWEYGDDEWLEDHKAAGGKTTMVEQKYRDDREMNMQHFRADLQGNVIVRHGEWFFIPEPDADPSETGTRYASEQMDSHQADRYHGARSPLPEECECGASAFEMGTENPRFGSEYVADITCKECGEDVNRPIFVRGEIRHTSNDHNAVNLGDTWHRAVQHDRNVMIYDSNPVAGGRRSGGWD